jgi:acyl-coenzyme A synthetase/AMP-(fatty) acid ligase
MYGFESTILLPLLSGAELTAERPYFPADIDAALARTPGRRTLFITPFHLRAWLAGATNARVETIVSATAPLSAELAREAEARTGARVLEIYGCTEAGQIATRRTAAGEEWTLYDGMRLREQDGRVVVSGGHVETPTPLQDVIEIRGDGRHFVLHGRMADMVNIAGKRNSIGYLNHQLASIPGVVDGVFHAPDEKEADGVTRLMAFVVAPTLEARHVLAALRERLDPAFLPRPLLMVEALPRESTGKITRAALEALAARARSRA